MDEDGGHEEIQDADNELEYSRDRELETTGFEYDVDKADLNDPTLEQFPSSRTDILNTVRKIETGLGEDKSVFEGVAPSPIIGPSRRGTSDILGDYYATSPIASSPVVTRSQERLRVSRSPHGSTSSLSLQSISEADEHEAATEEGSPRLSPGKPKLKALQTPDWDEDEGVAVKYSDKYAESGRVEHESGLLTPEAASSPRPLVPEILPEPVSDISDPIAEVAVPSTSATENSAQDEVPKTPKTILAENDEANSPRIVIQPAEEIQETPAKPIIPEPEDGPANSMISETETTATSTHLTKRVVSRSRPGTPASVRSTHLQADREGFFRAFFRVLFDWIGGLVNKLCGGN